MARAEDPAQSSLFDRAEVDPKLSRAAAARLAAAAEKAERDKTLAEWEARFERADWVAPYDCADGMKKGDSVLGWRCPACGDVEPTEFGLGNNHGYRLYDTHVPYRAEFGETCFRLSALAAHRKYDERRAMVRHLIGEGLDDEQIAAQAGWWDASTIAGYRKDEAKAARLAAKAAKGEVVRVGHGSECPCSFCNATCTFPCCVPDPQGVLL